MIVLGLTDVWSAIRNATVSRLSHVIEHFPLFTLEVFFGELYRVRIISHILHELIRLVKAKFHYAIHIADLVCDLVADL